MTFPFAAWICDVPRANSTNMFSGCFTVCV